jgi:hypothetical protein
MARALLASLIATAIVSALLYVNVRLGFLPAFDLLPEIAAFNTRLGLPATLNSVWAMHVFIGVIVWGVVFAVIRPILIGSGIVEGFVFGIITFLVMMVFFMPLAGRELFARDLPNAFIAASAGLNIVYGIVLGAAMSAIEDAGRDRSLA